MSNRMKPTIQVFYVTTIHNGEQADVAKFFQREHAEAHLEKVRGHALIDERIEDLDAQHAEHRKAQWAISVPFTFSESDEAKKAVLDEEFTDASK